MMMPLRRIAVWGCIIALLLHSRAIANDVEGNKVTPTLTGEFPIGKAGRLILLPVHVNGRKWQFLVDTGASRSAIDLAIPGGLGKSHGSQVLKTPAGHAKVETFDWPQAALGTTILKPNRLVAGVDFTDLRQASNADIFGVIGMDLLKNSRMQVDFDRGLVRFLDELPSPKSQLGQSIPVEFTDDDVPCVTAFVADEISERFLIDTGAGGNSLREGLFDALLEQKQLRLGGSFASITVGGETQGNRGYLDRLTLGKLAHDGLRMARVAPSSLGLRFLSRYVVTFDFVEGVMYLNQGADHSKPEPQASSGMALLWIEGQVVVKSVKSGGPADKSGVRADDVLVRVNGRDVAEYDHFSLRSLLTTQVGKKINMRFQRAGKTREVELTLTAD